MYVWEEGLRETTREQDCFKFSLKNRERDDSCLVSSGSWFHAAECENARSPNFVRSRAAWRKSTSRRSADEVDMMVHLPAGTCRRGTKDSDRCVCRLGTISLIFFIQCRIMSGFQFFYLFTFLIKVFIFSMPTKLLDFLLQFLVLLYSFFCIIFLAQPSFFHFL